MNTKLKKIAKTVAVGIFFLALFLNVKLSLTDPFVTLSNDALAQSSSSSSSLPYSVCCQSISSGCFTRDGSYFFPDDYVYYGQFCP